MISPMFSENLWCCTSWQKQHWRNSAIAQLTQSAQKHRAPFHLSGGILKVNVCPVSYRSSLKYFKVFFNGSRDWGISCILDSGYSQNMRTVVLGSIQRCLDVRFLSHTPWLSVQTRRTLLKGVMVRAVQHNVNKARSPTASEARCPTEKQ